MRLIAQEPRLNSPDAMLGMLLGSAGNNQESQAAQVPFSLAEPAVVSFIGVSGRAWTSSSGGLFGLVWQSLDDSHLDSSGSTWFG